MPDESVLIEAACKIHGCRKRDLLCPARINAKGQVVLILKPAGQKFIIDVPVEPATFEAAATLPGATFESLVPKRLWIVLEKHGLTDPNVLRGKSDEELLEVEGIGKHTLEQLRTILADV